MTNREIEQRIRTALEHAAPDRLDRILSSCDQEKDIVDVVGSLEDTGAGKKGNVIRMSGKDTKKRKSGLVAIAAAAAAFVLCFGGYALLQKNKAPQIDSVILLDVNPSLSLSVDGQERVVSAQALNDDAREVLGDMELEGTSLEVAVNAIIGSMLQKGYLGDMQNSILVSVENSDAARGEQLQQKVSQAIASAMQTGSLDAAVLSQTVSADDAALKELAEKYNISLGKAALIQEVIDQDPSMTFEALAPMTINDIALIASSRNMASQAVTQTGAASDKAYIGQEEALNRACAHAGVGLSDITHLEVEFDSEDGIMVYEVEFEAGSEKFEYDIDARTGEVLKCESKNKDKSTSSTIPVPEENTAAETPAAGKDYIGETAAKEAALAHAGVKESDTVYLHCYLDYDDGTPRHYEVEFKVGSIEYEYEIDLYSGAVLESSKETHEDHDDHDDPDHEEHDNKHGS